MDIKRICAGLRAGAEQLAVHTAERKNGALAAVAKRLDAARAEILSANARDVEKAAAAGMKESLIDRLRLTPSRIDSILESIRIIMEQTDPVGQCVAGWTTPNGLRIRQQRVPLGVASIIYESRPNVTVDAFALAYKSGNAILLRGSSSALESNKAIVSAIKAGLAETGVPEAIELACSGSHAEVDEILNAVGLIDVVLPRGGAALIKMVVEKARVPVIETGSGVCHLFIDESADIRSACAIAENAKLQRPGVCNAIETLVVHRAVLQQLLPALEETFAGRAEFRCDAESYPILKAAAEKAGRAPCVVRAVPEDFGYEFLDTILAVKTVGSVDEAIGFINAHNTHHSESVVTQSLPNAAAFQQRVDAACVYVNASTRFTDGGEFGFGAELGISTQKLHARGPMGLTALTTTKFFIDGEGQIR
ncbi:glutamate-5-semialdehyde dehydrogenase [Treponema brennaborense]|uniref:Gamma-glutamyl phosphate reductase n=1 Tax=Treponema brennaborense (strain DSM 12168 / CIP 105900 / DD5/3) TaxID=906968 RepID=F4LL27_TREBD|nr:glutamate-5-semialdehyde dehydrogenase [Treponema brennaborense]AEE17601.1 Gamma-glutamyl phosphate reductase [Treponema brennaborense DSM 12168]